MNHQMAYNHLRRRIWLRNRHSMSTPTRKAMHREWQAWQATWAKGAA